MGTRIAHTLVLAISAILVLSACELPVSPPRAGFHADVIDPPNGAVIPLGPLHYVEAEASSTRGAITLLDIYANGARLGGASDTDLTADPSSVDTQVDWDPPEAGLYLLQALAMRSAGLMISASNRVCVVDFPIDPGNAYYYSYGYEGECPIPPRDAAARPGTITLAAEASPDHLIYIPPDAGGFIPASLPGCVPQTTLAFQATVVDPPEDVALVAIHISLPIGPATSGRWGSLTDLTTTFLLHQTALFAGSTRIFEGSTDPRPTLGFIFGDLGGTVTWTAEALGRDGAVLLTDGPHTIPAAPCGPAVPPTATATAPTATKVPTPKPTLTPAPTACPPGTYLAPNAQKCVPIYLSPTTKPFSCSRYKDPSSCTSNGCSWDKDSGKCSNP